MRPVVINGDLWRVSLETLGSPALIDRTGRARLATADSDNKTIHILRSVAPPLLDQVLLHEIAHAVTMSYGLLDSLRAGLPEDSWVLAEEWSAQLIERHAVEAAVLAAEVLGRPLCIRGTCLHHA